MSIWPRRRRHEVVAVLVLLARRGEPLAAGLRELGRDDPGLARASAGLVERLEHGEDLASALVAEHLLNADEASTLGQDPAAALERLTRRWTADRAGTGLLRWYPLWLAVWWMLPGLILAVVVEGVSRHPFPMSEMIRPGGFGYLTPGLATLSGLVIGSWALINAALNHRWLQPLGFLLAPGARRALLARRLLDQAAAGPVPAGWWGERRLWYFSRGMRAAPAADAVAALAADGLLILDAAGRPDWTHSHQRVDEEVRSRLVPARALLIFGLVTAGIAGFASFMKVDVFLAFFDYPLFGLARSTGLAVAGTLGGIILLQIPLALGRRSLVGWNWNPAWPRMAEQLATTLERRADPLAVMGGCSMLIPRRMQARWEEACEALGSGDGSLMTVLARTGFINPPQRQAALAAEQAGREALIAWLHQEGAMQPALASAMGQLQVQLLFCLGISMYLAVAVLPKFQAMFASLHMVAPPSLRLSMEIFTSWWPWLLLGGLLVVGKLCHRRGWWPSQREASRLHRGDLLVRGLADGRSEADLAAILAFTWTRPPPQLAGIGPRGDWNRLLILAGWPHSTPTTLAEDVDRARLRLGRARARTVAIGLVLAPFLIALPVALTLHGAFVGIAVLNQHALAVAQHSESSTGTYAVGVIPGPEPRLIVPFLRSTLVPAPPLPGAAP